MSIFANKTLLITGGTGSFGNAVLNRFLDTDIKEIRIFSRDEKKQDDMRHEYQAKYPELSNKIKFYIGDVRDIQSVRNAIHGCLLYTSIIAKNIKYTNIKYLLLIALAGYIFLFPEQILDYGNSMTDSNYGVGTATSLIGFWVQIFIYIFPLIMQVRCV